MTDLVVGYQGQDGRLLCHDLTRQGRPWIGVGRGSLECSAAGWQGRVDIRSPEDVEGIVRGIQPGEIYYLAAFHHAAEEAPGDGPAVLKRSLEINVASLVNCLEAIRLHSPRTRLFYAASCHVFGNPRAEPQDEYTPFDPESVYGITKAAGVQVCRLYRRTHGVFAAAGILYNHESPLRGPGFLSARIVEGAARILRGSRSKVTIGDLDARADWGYAGEYVDAMRRILSADAPDDFVIATGVAHTVRDFVASTFGHLGLDWREHVEEVPSQLRRRTSGLIGNPAKLKRVTGWEARIHLPELARMLLQAKLDPSAAGASFE